MIITLWIEGGVKLRDAVGGGLGYTLKNDLQLTRYLQAKTNQTNKIGREGGRELLFFECL